MFSPTISFPHASFFGASKRTSQLVARWRLMVIIVAVIIGGGTAYSVATAAEVDQGLDDEFYFSNANEIIGAQFLHQAGGDGTSVKIGLADTGFYYSWPFLKEVTRDRIVGIRDFYGKDAGTAVYPWYEFLHGHTVAIVTAAARNGSGGQGIAYNSPLHIYKISSPDNLLRPRSRRHVSNMINQAHADGVGVISGAWGWWAPQSAHLLAPSYIRNFLAPLAKDIGKLRADKNGYRGTALVFAAGNNAGIGVTNVMGALPYWFPRTKPQILAVVALDARGWTSGDDVRSLQLSAYSSRCGFAKDWCIAAPSDGAIIRWINGVTLPVKGTTVATSLVVGSVAGLMDAFPEITAEDAVAILLATATDLGAPGVDDVYGHGLIDLERAMQPVGDQTITVNGRTTTTNNSYVGRSALLGDGFSKGLNETAFVFQDSFGRYFTSQFGTVSVGDRLQDQSITTQLADVSRAGPSSLAQWHTPLSVGALAISQRNGIVWHANAENVGISLAIGSVDDKAIIRRAAMPFDHIDRTALVSTLQVGAATIGELGVGMVLTDDAPTFFSTLHLPIGGHINLQTGVMVEQDRFHGAEGGGAFAFRGRAITRWAGFDAQWQLRDAVWLSAAAVGGHVDYRGASDTVFRAINGVMAKAHLGLRFENSFIEGDRFHLSAELPSTMLNGMAALDLPVRGGMRTQQVAFKNQPVYELRAAWQLAF